MTRPIGAGSGALAGSDNFFTHLDETRSGILESHILDYVSVNAGRHAKTHDGFTGAGLCLLTPIFWLAPEQDEEYFSII